jgi:hypothetical protein
VKSDDPTLRKEREGWGTRQLVEGIEPKSAFVPPFTCRRQASLLKSQTWATHSTFVRVQSRAELPEREAWEAGFISSESWWGGGRRSGFHRLRI